MQYRYAFGGHTSLAPRRSARVLRQALFRVIVGTAIAFMALLSPVSLAVASTHGNSLTNTGVASATTGSPQVQAVYGTSGSFTTSGTGACTATSLTQSAGVALDSSGGLYIADTYANRVLHFPAGSTTPDRVYGQPDFTHCSSNQGGNPSATTLNGPWGVAVSKNGGLYVADRLNNRVVFYPAGSTTATRVYGQRGSFTSTKPNNGGVSATSLNQPLELTLNASNTLCASDFLNHRVLCYPIGSTKATQVYGQGNNFTSNTANLGGVSASSLWGPDGVRFDSSANLYVADLYNNRVLFYPAGSSTIATRVYGQANSFTSNAANNGGVSATSLYSPFGLALDSSNNLYVADAVTNRVLYYPAGGSTTAIQVYGQEGNFTSYTANNGGLSPLSLHNPVDLALDKNGSIYVSDAGNARVLEYQPAVPRSCGITLTVGGIYQYAPLVVDSQTGYLHPLGESCTVDLRGYNLSGLEFGYGTEGYGPYIVNDKQLTLLTSGTTMNLVRVPYNVGWWLSDVYVPLANMHYRAWMDSVVQMIKRHGAYVELSRVTDFSALPCPNATNTCPSQADPSYPSWNAAIGADITHTTQFWQSIVPAYANDSAVIYNSWNEFALSNPPLWRQNVNTLITTIQATAHAVASTMPPAVVVLSDQSYAGGFDELINGSAADFTQSNLIYDFHQYDGFSGTHNGLACQEPLSSFFYTALGAWPVRADQQIGFVQSHGHAAMFGEWGGCYDTDDPNGAAILYHSRLTSYARAHHIGLAYYEAFVSVLTWDASGFTGFNDNGLKVQQAYNYSDLS